jgi:hypothetical protein
MKWFFLLAAFSAYSQTGTINSRQIQEDLDDYYQITIKQIYPGKKKARISFLRSWPLNKRGFVLAKFPGGNECSLPILEIGEKDGEVFIGKCPYLLKREQLLSLPPLRVALDKNYQEDSMELQRKREIGNLPSANENYYLFTGIGVTPVMFAPEISSAIKEFGKGKSMKNIGIGVEVLGIYFPLNRHRSLLGGNFGFIYNKYSSQNSFQETSTTEISQLSRLEFWQIGLAASFFHFFGQNIGDGPFFRGDFGFSFFTGSLNVSYTANSGPMRAENQNYSYKPGPALLIGGGYAWPLSLSTRLLAFLNASLNSGSQKEDGVRVINKMISLGLGLLF